jgi:hypothetical protein
MQAGVYQKVLDDAELIALVRQTQDQFEAHGDVNACCAAAPACKGRVRAVNGVELARIESGNIGKTEGESNMIARKRWPRIQVACPGWAFFVSPWRFPQIRK